jgi:hypothetical protein
MISCRFTQSHREPAVFPPFFAAEAGPLLFHTNGFTPPAARHQNRFCPFSTARFAESDPFSEQ